MSVAAITYAVETHGLTKKFAGFRAVNEVDLRLEAGKVHALVGLNGAGKDATWRYKLLAFVLSGGLAGLAGGLFALGNGFASLDLLHWTTSGQAVLITILGGIGTLWGSLLGAVIVLELRDALTSAPEASGVATGAVFVVIVLAFRRGLWGHGPRRSPPVRLSSRFFENRSLRRGCPSWPFVAALAQLDPGAQRRARRLKPYASTGGLSYTKRPV